MNLDRHVTGAVTTNAFCLAIVVIHFLAGPLHGQDRAEASAAAADPFAELSCTSFEWIEREGFSPRAAMRVPVELDGVTYWFQLDTGSEGTVLYGETILEERGWREAEPSFVRVRDVRFGGGVHFPAARLFVRRNHPDDGSTAGTIGLNALLGHLVVIDFPGLRFCAVPRLDVPWAMLRDIAFTPAVVRDGKFFVWVSVGDEELDAVFYDTGASAFPLAVDFDLWKRVTGLAGPSAATRDIRVPSWGQEITLTGGRAAGDMTIADTRLGRREIFYLADDPNTFSGWPYRVTGLMRNEPFVSGIVVLDLGVEPRLGFLPRGPLPRVDP